MDPKQLREALAETSNGQTDSQFWFWISGPGVDIIEAARWAVGLCEDCEGTGAKWETPLVMGATRHGVECPSCDGRGFTLNRERVERAARTLQKRWEDDGEGSPYLWDDLAEKDKEFWLTWAEAAISAFLFGDSTEKEGQ